MPVRPMNQVTGGIVNDPMTKKARELYVGNLPDGAQEANLMSFLNAALIQAGLLHSPGMPITSLRINNGKFAFAEFRNAEEATLGCQLNGIVLGMHALNVNRPSAYAGPPTGHTLSWPETMAQKIHQNPELAASAIGMPAAGTAVCGSAGGNKTQFELYIGNLPDASRDDELLRFLNQEMISKMLVTAPGNAFTQSRVAGRFAFAELRSIEETDKALALNGVQFNGCALRVGRPRAYVPPEVLAAGLAMTPSIVPTCAIQLKNMVKPDELRDDIEYQEIKDEIHEEMTGFGEIDSVEIPRPLGEAVPVYCGNVYIKYKEIRAAAVAQENMEGRTFGGASVQCCFYPEEKFNSQEWINL